MNDPNSPPYASGHGFGGPMSPEEIEAAAAANAADASASATTPSPKSRR